MIRVFLISLFSFFVDFLHSQSDFLDYKYFWTETYSCFGIPPHVETSRFTLDSNSINVVGRSFYEVLRSPTMTGNNFEGTGTYVSGLDSNKVYSYNGTEIKLLFDYTLEEGDTLYTHNGFDCKMIVGDIDTILLLNGEEERKWIFYESGEDFHPEYEDAYPSYWIEGIGNNYGLFGNEQFCQIDGCGSGLLCVHFENELIYNSWPSNDSCWYTTSTISIPTISLSVYPNPATTTIYIHDPEAIMESGIVEDLVGQPLIHTRNHDIDISTLPPGYYFFIIELENKQTIMKQFVKL